MIGLDLVEGLPAAVQIVGRRYREDLICDALEAIEDRNGVLTHRLWERRASAWIAAAYQSQLTDEWVRRGGCSTLTHGSRGASAAPVRGGSPMKFGIFFELSVPRPFEQNERIVYENALEQTRLADELGFDQVWAVEHHFLEEYSHCSAPELFLTACAMQTERIRVGHGIVTCVPRVQPSHPDRRAGCVLDLLSGGRLELGTGRSATWTELGGFEANPDDTKKTWDEFVHALPKMWTQERYRHDGQFFSMPSRAVLPKPIQKPHPPMWVAVSSPGTEDDAADRGMGCLGVNFTSFAEQERKVKEYRRRIQHCDPGRRVRERSAEHDQLPLLPR